MKTKGIGALLGLMGLLLVTPDANAVSILVGRCVVFEACWTSHTPTPWSETLMAADLAALGLGTNVHLIAAATSPFVVRLGPTTMTFTRPSGLVTEIMPREFNGDPRPFLADGGNPCSTRPGAICDAFRAGPRIGGDGGGLPLPPDLDFFRGLPIPSDATAATISGTFGNSHSPNSAGVNLCLGPIGESAFDIALECSSGQLTPLPDSPVPEPGTLALFGTSLAGLGIFLRRRGAAR